MSKLCRFLKKILIICISFFVETIDSISVSGTMPQQLRSHTRKSI